MSVRRGEDCSTAEAGREGEGIAREYLSSRGFTILARNYRFGGAEVDIVGLENGVLVFCEVKLRRGGDFGLPEESVTPRKQRQIRKAALGYVSTRGMEDRLCRFDVVAIEKKGASTEIRHWKDAF